MAAKSRTASLYLIALIPDEELRQRVKRLKEDMRDRYGAAHALKSPAHITLQMPFRRPETIEDRLGEVLNVFAADQSEFQVELDGFDAFPPRVIFLRIKDHQPIVSLHRAFADLLRNSIGLESREITSRIHPHMTLATRDLGEAEFHKAYAEFGAREFHAVFTVNSLFLLKHNGRFWDIRKEFAFGN